MPCFQRDDLRLYYAERGPARGEPIVLMHGLLWSARMMEDLARRLKGRRVYLLDLHGHGRSDKPTDPVRYTFAEMVADVIGLLDHLGLDRAAVGGLSLGANVALATAQRHPERVSALVLEMPVLHRGHPVGKVAFGALAGFYAASRTVLAPVTAAVRRAPLPRALAAPRDVAAADPTVAAALLRGLLADEPIPEDAATLARVSMPTLVIGHRRDPLHVLADAKDLADNLPSARFVEASSIVEHRLKPQQLADLINEFLDGPLDRA
jgi:pimeloyl-ACP methyl ester carboxylesterase